MAFIRTTIQAPDLAEFVDIAYPYLGEVIAVSSNGLQAVATCTPNAQQARLYILTKASGSWAIEQVLDMPETVLWLDPFDGTQTDRPPNHHTPTGTIVQAGGKLTISVPAGASPWATCPAAWRHEMWLGHVKYQTAISSFPTTEDLRAGICMYDNGVASESDRHRAFLFELFYSGGSYYVQVTRVALGVITAVGSPIEVPDPNVEPLHLELYYLQYDGYLWARYRGDSDETWTNASFSEDWGGVLSGDTDGLKTGLHLRNLGANPAGAAAFNYAQSLLPNTYAEAISASIESNTIAASWKMLFDVQDPLPAEAATPAAGEQAGWDVSVARMINPVSAKEDVLIAAGAPGYSADQGRAIVSRLRDGVYSQLDALVASDGVAGDKFGYSLDWYHGNSTWRYRILAVGAPYATIGGNAGAGAVYVFLMDADGEGLTQIAKVTAPVPAANAHFGWDVRVSLYSTSFSLAAGEPAGNGGRGAVHLFLASVATPATWVLSRTVTDPAGAIGDDFGYAVGVDQRYMAIGAPGKAAARGSWFYSTATPTLVEFSAAAGAAGDRLGESIEFPGYSDGVFVGAPDRDGTKGGVFAFRWTGATYAEHQEFAPTYRQAGDRFGRAVASRSGDDLLLVGADGSGAASGYFVEYQFIWGLDIGADPRTRGWVEFERQRCPSPEAADRFGHALALPEDYNYYVAGAPGATTGGQAGAGRAYGYLVGRGGPLGWFYPSHAVQIVNKSVGVWSAGQLVTPLDHGMDLPYFANNVVLSEDANTLLELHAAGTYIYDGCVPLRVFKRSGGTYQLAQNLIEAPRYEPPQGTDDNAVSTNYGVPYVQKRQIGKYSAAPAYDGVSMSDDASIIVAGDLHYGANEWHDNFDDGAVGLSTSIPNPACTITEAAGVMAVAVNSVANPADWSGGGVYSCPLAYVTPLPHTVYTPSRAAHYQATIRGFSATDQPNAYAGIALFANPASDALILEYNRTTQKLTVWTTVGGGAKTVIYTSPLAIGDCTTSYLTLDLTYDYGTGKVYFGYKRGSTYGYNKGECTLGFVPTKFGMFGRIASPSASTLTVSFLHTYAWTAWLSAIRVWRDIAGTYVEQLPIHPADPQAVNSMFYPGAGTFGEILHLSRGAQYLAAGDATNYHIYQHTGGGAFVLDQQVSLSAGTPQCVAISDDPVVVDHGPMLLIADRNGESVERWERLSGTWSLAETFTTTSPSWFPGNVKFAAVSSVPSFISSDPYMDIGAIGSEGEIYLFDFVSGHPLYNRSFEEAGNQPGEATWWSQDVNDTAEDVAPFWASDGYTRPWDGFEEVWGLYPYNHMSEAEFEAVNFVQCLYEGLAYDTESFEYSWREPVSTGPVAYNHQSSFTFDMVDATPAMFDTTPEAEEDLEEDWGLSPYNQEAIWTYTAGTFNRAMFDSGADNEEDFENTWGVSPYNDGSEFTFDPGNFTPCAFDAPPMDYEDFEHTWTETLP